MTTGFYRFFAFFALGVCAVHVAIGDGYFAAFDLFVAVLNFLAWQASTPGR